MTAETAWYAALWREIAVGFAVFLVSLGACFLFGLYWAIRWAIQDAFGLLGVR